MTPSGGRAAGQWWNGGACFSTFLAQSSQNAGRRRQYDAIRILLVVSHSAMGGELSGKLPLRIVKS